MRITLTYERCEVLLNALEAEIASLVGITEDVHESPEDKKHYSKQLKIARDLENKVRKELNSA